jgi:hypothetical protein
MPFRNFELESNKTKAEIIEEIQKLMNDRFDMVSEKILYGKIKKSSILKATINAPFPLSDPFKNVVFGLISESDNKTTIKLRARFSIINILLCFLFYFPFLFDNNTVMDSYSFKLTTGLNLIGATLLFLKLRWDSNRLIRSLNEVIK